MNDCLIVSLGSGLEAAFTAHGDGATCEGESACDGADLDRSGTLDTSEEGIVQFLSCAYLMEWGEPRRIAGPTNQGDTTVKVGSGIAVAQAYRALAEELMTKKRRELAQLYPPVRRFVRT